MCSRLKDIEAKLHVLLERFRDDPKTGPFDYQKATAFIHIPLTRYYRSCPIHIVVGSGRCAPPKLNDIALSGLKMDSYHLDAMFTG